jgi:hypothetical protein
MLMVLKLWLLCGAIGATFCLIDDMEWIDNNFIMWGVIIVALLTGPFFLIYLLWEEIGYWS